ncbi:hypothetical protein [Candidatus Uabimicrobium amorphum]|uniref:Uncharacterized protein n=1 Tax=Uabimicrobium amorphum TaxID=2596890 RepID=A0A5S9ILR2_UABAM|nr:hypothetical protein [Candidatus Uabimicrobium amorphum]BBM83662.1 hypothetical protein UABAM_02015 [Candidatus Uabimicrobium amorphum]
MSLKTKYISLFFVFATMVYADTKIELKFSTDKGLIHSANALYENSWEIQKKNKTLTTQAAAKYIKFYNVSIVKRGGATLEIFTLPSTANSLSWKIPNTTKNEILIVTVTAVPKRKAFPRIRGKTHFYVVPNPPSLKLPKDFSQSLVVLMDWNGKRGFCKKLAPLKALEYAQATCKYIRQNYNGDDYGQYLEVITKVETASVAYTTIYCETKRARVNIDGHNIGFFENWDAKRRMYSLRFLLPVRAQKTYKISVAKGEYTYTGSFIHAKSSELVVNLSKKVSVVISCKQPFKIKTPRIRTELGNKHQIYVHQEKVTSISLQFSNVTLRIDFIAKDNNRWLIEKNQQYFSLNIDGKSYPFINNKVSLLDF